MPYPLLTPRLSIEPLVLQDVEAFVGYRRDPEIARYQSWATDYSLTQAVELIESQHGIERPSSGDWLQLAIRDRMSGALLGDLGLHALQSSEGSYEIGVTLAAEHQGQGIAREAVRRLLEFLFDEVGATNVIASCDSRNVSSIKLLEALGFHGVPAKRWSEIFKGESILMEFFEMTPPNWLRLSKQLTLD
jgi:RimJ/RimL family protein N-acetyltransferase